MERILGNALIKAHNGLLKIDVNGEDSDINITGVDVDNDGKTDSLTIEVDGEKAELQGISRYNIYGKGAAKVNIDGIDAKELNTNFKYSKDQISVDVKNSNIDKADIVTGRKDDSVSLVGNTFGELDVETNMGRDEIYAHGNTVKGDAELREGWGSGRIEATDNTFEGRSLLKGSFGDDEIISRGNHHEGDSKYKAGFGNDDVEITDSRDKWAYFGGGAKVKTGPGDDKLRVAGASFKGKTKIKTGHGKNETEIHDSTFEDKTKIKDKGNGSSLDINQSSFLGVKTKIKTKGDDTQVDFNNNKVKGETFKFKTRGKRNAVNFHQNHVESKETYIKGGPADDKFEINGNYFDNLKLRAGAGSDRLSGTNKVKGKYDVSGGRGHDDENMKLYKEQPKAPILTDPNAAPPPAP